MVAVFMVSHLVEPFLPDLSSQNRLTLDINLLQLPSVHETMRNWVCFCVFGSRRNSSSDQAKYTCFHEQASLPPCDDCDITGVVLMTIKILKMM